MSTTNTTTNFVITKAMIEGYCNAGLTVEEMAAKIKEVSGIECPVGKVRKAATHYKIDLRKKPKKSAFLFEDAVVSNTTEVKNEPTATQEG